jgi:hypothetical protein
MRHDQVSTFARDTECKKTILILGMIWILESKREGIAKYGRRFVKAHTVLFRISLRFVPVPFESHDPILSDSSRFFWRG